MLQCSLPVKRESQSQAEEKHDAERLTQNSWTQKCKRKTAAVVVTS